MNVAMCYVSIGDSAIKLFNLSYKSLRKSGFDGDIYLLTTDEKERFDINGDEKVIYKKLTEKEINLEIDSENELAICDVRKLDLSNPRNEKSKEKFVICHGKTLIKQLITSDKYDWVVYLDSDILVQGSIKKLYDFLNKNENKIIISTSRMKKIGSSVREMANGSFRRQTVAANLSNKELIMNWFTKPICADVVCIPLNQIGESFLEDWQNECSKGIDSDQAALQAILLKQHRENHVKAPYDIFGYSVPSHSYNSGDEIEEQDSLFVHFGGAIKNSVVMEGYYNKYIRFKVF
jgi:lipopolysaccharide biosynthesis glycosyltransferase